MGKAYPPIRLPASAIERYGMKHYSSGPLPQNELADLREHFEALPDRYVLLEGSRELFPSELPPYVAADVPPEKESEYRKAAAQTVRDDREDYERLKSDLMMRHLELPEWYDAMLRQPHEKYLEKVDRALQQLTTEEQRHLIRALFLQEQDSLGADLLSDYVGTRPKPEFINDMFDVRTALMTQTAYYRAVMLNEPVAIVMADVYVEKLPLYCYGRGVRAARLLIQQREGVREIVTTNHVVQAVIIARTYLSAVKRTQTVPQEHAKDFLAWLADTCYRRVWEDPSLETLQHIDISPFLSELQK